MIGRHNGKRLGILVVAVIATVSAVGLPRLLGLRINMTSSLPKGIYAITKNASAPLIEFCPEEPFSALSAARRYRPPGPCPDGAAPLLKPIVARAGDTVVLSADGIRVNGRLLANTAPQHADTAGRPLVGWPAGIYQVSSDVVWVASTYHPNSFDSRYFGPVSVRAIRHRLKPLWVLRSAPTGH